MITEDRGNCYKETKALHNGRVDVGETLARVAGRRELSEELRDGMEGRRGRQGQRQGQEFEFHPWQ